MWERSKANLMEQWDFIGSFCQDENNLYLHNMKLKEAVGKCDLLMTSKRNRGIIEVNGGYNFAFMSILNGLRKGTRALSLGAKATGSSVGYGTEGSRRFFFCTVFHHGIIFLIVFVTDISFLFVYIYCSQGLWVLTDIFSPYSLVTHQ